ncbi:DEAD/DEAH box helicase family protein [Streptomyces sp. NPDC008238]
MPGTQLREHQVDATARIRAWVGFPERSAVPAEGARATLVSATGSGKTITAAAAALDLRGGVPHRRAASPSPLPYRHGRPSLCEGTGRAAVSNPGPAG